MEDEDYRIMVLNDTTMKVFRDGRIMSFNQTKKIWDFRKTRTDRGGYYSVCIGRISYKVHKIIALCYLGERPNGLQIDHINGNNQDNNFMNLQYITPQNNCRKRVNAIGRPIKGYSKTKHGKFKSDIKTNGKSIYLGTYDTEDEARQAYIDGKVKYHGVQF